jgi:predicted small lipoprotein YifL
MSNRHLLRGRTLIALALSGAIALGGSLSGCGQKGALRLPQQKKTRVPPTPSNPAPDDSDTPADTPPSDTPSPTSDSTPPA